MRKHFGFRRRAEWDRRCSLFGAVALTCATLAVAGAEDAVAQANHFQVTYQSVQSGRNGYETVASPKALSGVKLSGHVLFRATVTNQFPNHELHKLFVDWSRPHSINIDPTWAFRNETPVADSNTMYQNGRRTIEVVLDTTLLPNGNHTLEIRGWGVDAPWSGPDPVIEYASFSTYNAGATSEAGSTTLHFIDEGGNERPAAGAYWKPTDSLRVDTPSKMDVTVSPMQWANGLGSDWWKSAPRLPLSSVSPFEFGCRDFMGQSVQVRLDELCDTWSGALPNSVGGGEALGVRLQPPALTVTAPRTGQSAVYPSFQIYLFLYDPYASCVSAGC